MSNSRAVDRESRRVAREELLTNLFVEAGAGSGKTQMLAERMAAGVAAGVYEIEHMAAVTFTRKAASELRGRFHLALEKQRHEVDQIPDLDGRALARQRIEGALGNLERFFAGTIHSFCARLLRERPVESGVSPGFTELDEVQDFELRKRIWRDFVTSTRSAGDSDMMALLDADVRPKDLDGAFATICLNEDVEFPAGEADCPDTKSARKALEEFWKQLQKHLPPDIDPATTCAIQKAAREFRGQLDVSRYRLDRPSVMASLLAAWDCESKIVQKWWADSPVEKKRLRDLINALHEGFSTETISPYLSQWRQYVYRLSVTLLTRAREYAARERRRLNALNYGDLLILTARVLRENADVRRSLQQKYRHLFVDEFQDTDPVQAEIVFLLAAAESPIDLSVPAAAPTTGADWRTVALRPGALFVVGDPKQSIYRFRRADIDIYNIVRDRFSDSALGRVLPLTMNFRSVPVLCDWANEVFKTRFPSEPTTHSPRFAALDAKENNTASGGVFTLTHSCERSEVHDQDAERIATYIRAEVDGGRRKCSDFLILTRKKRSRIVPYARALEARNIPIEVSGAGAFGESKEVSALVALLRALADPQDTLTLIAVLRGPLFGISDPELFAFRQSGGWFSIFAGTDEGSEYPRPDSSSEPPGRSSGAIVRAALAALLQYHRWTRILPAGAALERILEHTGYLALSATTPGGVEAGDLLHAVDRVRQVVEEGGSLADAAEALEEDADESNEVESLPLEPGRTDVVRVMNPHKAKGLEADVVFLADPNGGFPLRVDDHIERKGPKAYGWFKLVQRSEANPWSGKLLGEHADWPVHELAEQPYRQAEEDRLLYVAATRAREMLVVSRWTGNQTLKAWGVLNDFLASAKELPIPQSVPVPSVEPLDCSDQAQADSTAARVASHDRARQPSWSVTSVTADAKHIVRAMRTADAAADDPTRVVSADTPTHRADAGMAWGTLIHGLLEHAMRHQAATREDLRRLAMWLTVDEPQLRPSIDDAINTVLRVARAEFWPAAQEGEHAEETPFAVAHAGNELMTGVIDLLFKSADAWHIRDYKTDVSLHASAYERQLNVYRRALERVGCNVADVALVHVRNGE
jgi:ATP-dependent helicase/nuclease subunit A